MAKGICIVEHCDQLVFYRSAGLCRQCYQRMRYWNAKTITERMQRRRRLQVWDASLSAMDPSVAIVPSKIRRRRSA